MLTKWESTFLIMMTIPIMGHVTVVPILLDVAGRDSWISVLISLPFAIVFGYVIFQLRSKYPNQDFREVIYTLFGKLVGFIVLGIIVCYFLFISAISIASLADMVGIEILPETPVIALIIWPMIFCLYAVFKGLKNIAMTAGILAVFSITAGFLVAFLSIPLRDWSEIKPVLEFGWLPPLMGAMILMGIWAELLFLLFIPLQNAHDKTVPLLWIFCILFNSYIIIATTTGAIMSFGLGQADNFSYPAMEVVRILSLGFIDRFDIYGEVLMAFGCFIRASLYLRIGYNLIIPSGKTEGRPQKTVLYAMWSILFVFSTYIATNHIRLYKFTILYTYGAVFILLPFLLLIFSVIRNKRSSAMKPVTE